MKYSVVFYFNEETNNKISSLIQMIAGIRGNDYNVPPHITIADFNCEDLNHVINTLEVCKNKINQDFVYWASIGLFNPSVLFLAPVVSKLMPY